jgi:hypothetical protein
MKILVILVIQLQSELGLTYLSSNYTQISLTEISF